jgi:hypothetical protein
LTEHYDLATLMQAFFVVEFFPYHSARYKAPRSLLPSQELLVNWSERVVEPARTS